MKKQVVLVAGLAVLATPAFATKARLQALGESTNGSYYIGDNRNVFLNVAEINTQKDLVTYEWGDADESDTSGDPIAEGGFYKSMGNFNYGVQLGRQSEFQQLIQKDATNAAVDLNASNTIDFMIGGDAGVKWGFGVSYVSEKNDAATPKTENKSVDLTAGVSTGNLSGFVRYGLSGEANDGANDVERKGSYVVGGTYLYNDYTIYGQYKNLEMEKDNAAKDFENSGFEVGVGRQSKLNDKAVLFTKVSFVDEETTTLANVKTELMEVPVVVGLEYDATSWLTLRGSVAQKVYSANEVDGKDQTAANSTTVNAGATLKFGDLSVDGVIGNNNNGAAPGDSTANGAGQLRTDSLMSRVSFTYRF